MDQEIDHALVAPLARQVKRAVEVDVLGVRVCATLEELLGSSNRAGPDRVEQAAVGTTNKQKDKIHGEHAHEAKKQCQAYDSRRPSR